MGSLMITELRRWAKDGGLQTALVATLLALAGLTYAAVHASATNTGEQTGAVRVDTETVLTPASTQADLAELMTSGPALFLPLVAALVGASMAGRELDTGALAVMAASVRRLRLLMVARFVILCAVLASFGLLGLLTVTVAADMALSSTAVLDHLSVWPEMLPMAPGTVALTAACGILTFALSLITRRRVVVIVLSLAYLMVLEPAASSLMGERDEWLPRVAISSLLGPGASWLPALPTLSVIGFLAVWAVASLRRDRAYT